MITLTMVRSKSLLQAGVVELEAHGPEAAWAGWPPGDAIKPTGHGSRTGHDAPGGPIPVLDQPEVT